MTPGNPLVGGTVLRIPAIQSPNFSLTDQTGWAIYANGDAYFFNITAAGTVTGSSLIIDGATGGVFTYSGTPAAGNLTATAGIAVAGTDEDGNHYLAGQATYGAGYATALSAGYVAFYTGSLSDGWTFQAQIETDSGGDLILTPGASGSISLAGNVTVSGTFTASGDTGTSGLPNGTISGTSGGASAGTAHTHGPGSFAVTDGQHAHTL